MKVVFSLGWLPTHFRGKKAFKSTHVEALFQEYVKRIYPFLRSSVCGQVKVSVSKTSDVRRWVCDSRGKNVTSEVMAEKLSQVSQEGCKELQILIGGADGFSKVEMGLLKPDFTWSFGALTFPHELASVMACEQIYRAYTILRKMPYHMGHT